LPIPASTFSSTTRWMMYWRYSLKTNNAPIPHV
jgi:hypothetical protein